MSTPEHKYASYALEPRNVLLIGAGLTVLMVAALVLVALLLPAVEEERIEGEEVLHPMSGARTAPAEPLLQSNPYRELAVHAAEVDRRLATYGWIEKPSGVIHVPVERAIELLVERGLPVRRGDGR